VYSRGEAGFAAAAFAAAGAGTRHRLRIETRGREGVAFMQNDVTRIVPVEAVEADDSTGAGDTFVGGFLAAWMKTADPELAIKAGAAAARTLLLSRADAARRR
jgi:ribokinase